MKNLLKRYFLGRRKVHWILTSVVLISLCLVIVLLVVGYGEKTSGIEAVEWEEPKVQISFVDQNPEHYYVAAVVEYEVLYLPDVRLAIRMNLQYIIDAIAECGRLGADIAVFPEASLLLPVPTPRISAILISVYVPSADEHAVPCHHAGYEQSYLRQISCAAKQSRIYVAVNVIEKISSKKSSYWDGLLFHNTEVVFDRNGMVVARYRKFNLYGEQWFGYISTTDEPEFATFKTDFGVEFGIITCFDIFFTKPAAELAKQYNITHFIHSSMMLSRLPFIIAAPLEFGWSYALDVVVLSSSSPFQKYAIGTNVFFGRRPGTRTYIQPTRSSNIIISPVPKTRNLITPEYPTQFHQLDAYVPGKNRRQTQFLVEHVLDRMTTRVLTSTSNRNTATFSYKSETFECNISATWDLVGYVPSNHQFIAYSGPNNHSIANINSYSEMCGITLCSRYSSMSCRQPPNFDDASKSIFTSVNISTRSTSLESIRIPIAFDSTLMALNVTNFDFRSRSEDYFGQTVNRVEMKLKRTCANLVTFAIHKYGTKPTPIPNFNVVDFLLNEDIA